MCRRGPIFHDDSTVRPQYDDKPLTMEELDVAKTCDFDLKYGHKFAFDFSDDLVAIDQSMMQSPKSNRHRRRKPWKYAKFRFVPSLVDIKENELFETQLMNNKLKKLEKDLAAIHQERALNCGMSISKDEGHRRDRRKGQSRSSRGKI